MKGSMLEYLDTHATGRKKATPKGRVRALAEFAQAHIRLKGRAFSFEGHKYLRQIYDDQHPDIVWEKAAQMGISIRALAEGLNLCEEMAVKCLYYLSTDNDAEDFANDRVNPIVDGSEHLKSIVRTSRRRRDNVGLKHIGDGTLYLRGVESIRNVKSVDGDVIILDELDEANQRNVQFAQDRLLHSDLHYERRLSQPSIPDYGISREFTETDQHYWFLKCPSCNHAQCLELECEDKNGVPMPRNFMKIPDAMRSRFPEDQTYYRGCLKCGAELDMEKGEWVAQQPSRDRRGYHVSQLYTTVTPPGQPAPADRVMTELINARTVEQKTRVVNSIIGKAYGGDRQPLTEETLAAAEGDHGFLWRSDHPCYLGVDMGDIIHAAVLDAPAPDILRIIWLETLNDPDELELLMDRYAIVMGVIDSMPEGHTARKFCKKYPGRAATQRFSNPVWKLKEEEQGDDVVQEIQIDRTLSLDDTTSAIIDAATANHIGRVPPNSDGIIMMPRGELLDIEAMTENLVCRRHLTLLVKDLVVNKQGKKRWDYKHNVENHFGMAINSARIARKFVSTEGGGEVDWDLVKTSGESYATATAFEVQSF